RFSPNGARPRARASCRRCFKATLAEYARWQDNVTLARTRARLKLLRAETSLTPLTSVADANRRYEYVVPANDDTSFFKWFTSSLYKGATLAMSASVGKLRDVTIYARCSTLPSAF
ncbi:hypothetical protein MTO96_046737, partial [Rhipicephalus appendiculatus]